MMLLLHSNGLRGKVVSITLKLAEPREFFHLIYIQPVGLPVANWIRSVAELGQAVNMAPSDDGRMDIRDSFEYIRR